LIPATRSKQKPHARGVFAWTDTEIKPARVCSRSWDSQEALNGSLQAKRNSSPSPTITSPGNPERNPLLLIAEFGIISNCLPNTQ